MAVFSLVFSNRRRILNGLWIVPLFTLLALLLCFLSEPGDIWKRVETIKQYYSHEKLGERPCVPINRLQDIFVVIRTGSNELRRKLNPHLTTTLSCLPHYGIWSDWEETYAGHQVANALDDIDPDLLAHHPDFHYYRRLQEHGPDGFSAEELADWSQVDNTASGRNSPPWKLDKWKFLPLAKKVFEQDPSSPWYMFIECDTYVFWDSLVAWLSHFDSTRPLYIGRQMSLGDLVFAYGGAGFLISNPAMRILVERYTTNEKFYNDFTISQWAGDAILAQLMADANISLSPAKPTLESNNPATIDFQYSWPTGHPFWCYYATTYHHMRPYEIAAYHEFEQFWKSTHPGFPRNGDIYRHLIMPLMSSVAKDWDNLSPDIASNDASFEECFQICEAYSDCVQFSLRGRTCKTSQVAKLGYQEEQSSGEDLRSFWMTQRIEALVAATEATCNGQEWTLP
ncbi:hypothetical protein F5Y12DRAFT_789634 [Xylaria sp. FL1777]|nr:hypothetical protein F5Y12DRAFT_789634 [Xylaria sp. FL1777]